MHKGALFLVFIGFTLRFCLTTFVVMHWRRGQNWGQYRECELGIKSAERSVHRGFSAFAILAFKSFIMHHCSSMFVCVFRSSRQGS
jgi:hypothetical protein